MAYLLVCDFARGLYEFIQRFLIVLYVKIIVCINKIYKRDNNVIRNSNIEKLREI